MLKDASGVLYLRSNAFHLRNASPDTHSGSADTLLVDDTACLSDSYLQKTTHYLEPLKWTQSSYLQDVDLSLLSIFRVLIVPVSWNFLFIVLEFTPPKFDTVKHEHLFTETRLKLTPQYYGQLTLSLGKKALTFL